MYQKKNKALTYKTKLFQRIFLKDLDNKLRNHFVFLKDVDVSFQDRLSVKVAIFSRLLNKCMWKSSFIQIKDKELKYLISDFREILNVFCKLT